MLLSRAVDGYLISFIAEGNSRNCEINYRRYLERQLVPYLGDRALETVTAADVNRFMAYLHTEYRPKRKNGDTGPLKAKSLVDIWCAVRSFFGWCLREGLIDKRPDANLKKPEAQSPEIKPFNREEVQALLKVASRTRHKFRDVAILLVLLDTGLRATELTRLLVKDVDLKSGEVAVIPYNSGRKSHPRHVYLSVASKKAVWRYLAERSDDNPNSNLFLANEGRAMDRNSLHLMLNRIAKVAKVRGANPHKFRHTFACEYIRNGGDAFTLQRLLGHSTLEMVRRYLALVQGDIATAHRSASPVSGWKL